MVFHLVIILLVSGFLDQAKPELDKAAVYLGLQQLETNKSAVNQSSAVEVNLAVSSTSGITANKSEVNTSEVTETKARRGRKKADE
jgi:hypothetical protein